MYLLTFAPIENSYQTAHPQWPISIRCSYEETLHAFPNAPSEVYDQISRILWIFAGRACTEVRVLTLSLNFPLMYMYLVQVSFFL